MKNSSPRGTVRPGPGHHKQYGALAGWRAVRGGGALQPRRTRGVLGLASCGSRTSRAGRDSHLSCLQSCGGWHGPQGPEPHTGASWAERLQPPQGDGHVALCGRGGRVWGPWVTKPKLLLPDAQQRHAFAATEGFI